MKHILIPFLIFAATSFCAQAHRNVEKVSVYHCVNKSEVVTLFSGHRFDGDVWLQIQGANWSQQFRHMDVIRIAGSPALTSEQDGVRITVRIFRESLDVAYANKGLFTCNFVERLDLVSYGK